MSLSHWMSAGLLSLAVLGAAGCESESGYEDTGEEINQPIDGGNEPVDPPIEERS